MQDESQRKLVRAVVDIFAERLLRTHVAGRAHHRAFAGEVFVSSPAEQRFPAGGLVAVRLRPATGGRGRSRGSLLVPSLASMMFSGLRSRWTIPAACAAATVGNLGADVDQFANRERLAL